MVDQEKEGTFMTQDHSDTQELEVPGTCGYRMLEELNQRIG